MMFLASLAYPQADSDLKSFKYIGIIGEFNDQRITAGQLSKDGKEYYHALVTEDGDGIVEVYSISDSGETELIKTFKINGLDGKTFFGQISLSEDKLIMVFTVNNNNERNYLDLYLAGRKSVEEDFTVIRPLDEINAKGNYRAHPWLSADGNRIYLKLTVPFTFMQEHHQSKPIPMLPG